MIPGEVTERARPRSVLAELRSWPARRWWFAAGIAVATVVVVAVVTAMIPTPWFMRDVPTTDWAWPVLIVSSVLAGLVAATYVARKDGSTKERAGAMGVSGAIVTFFAVGCPVCNKLVLLALGYAGALQFFEPLQPYLAGGSIVLLVAALVQRVRRERSCPLPGARATDTEKPDARERAAEPGSTDADPA